jgi:diacylglycerol O-acyltransferase / wax synthase
VTCTRLSSLDASFLEVETATAHMHVGWVALFAPPPDGVSFERLRDHIAARMGRAPCYRQKLAFVPFGLHDPVWVDDERFHVDRHVFHATASDIGAIADAVFSVPLDRDRPLWEMWIADRLEDGRIGVVGKTHHCMVDGIAAVELGALLLDPTPDAPEPEPDLWRPRRQPDRLTLLGDGLRDLVREQLDVMTLPARVAGSPRRLLDAAASAERVASTLTRAMRPAPRVAALNPPISPHRLLARLSRPLGDLQAIKERHGVTLNDVVLAASAGGVGRFLRERGDLPVRLKAMVPVNVRDRDNGNGNGNGNGLGNHISFMFIELPCDEPDPVARLRDLALATRARKRAGDPEIGDAAIQALGRTPHPLQRLVSRLAASPRTFNLVVSNIPGPRGRLYMRGCELLEAYPVVPLADRHALSIGFTAIRDTGCFGLYADRESLPDAALLAQDIADAIDELLQEPGDGGPKGTGATFWPRVPVGV